MVEKIKIDHTEIVIDELLRDFHHSVDSVVNDPQKYQYLLQEISKFNPSFIPVSIEAQFAKTEVLANVVGGVYAPLIHGFAGCILRNIQSGVLPNNVLAPPRDAIPLATALRAQAQLAGVEVQILSPHVNRNTAGIANNQKEYQLGESPLLQLHLDQVNNQINGSPAIVEMETGIYGTTSLVMAKAFKNRGLQAYFPIKFYGLGPNLSYVHAILSDGQSWCAEAAEAKGLVTLESIKNLMVLLDTMEELGMEKFYKSVEELTVDESGLVIPMIVPATVEEQEIARVTNQVLSSTASVYADVNQEQIKDMLLKVPSLIEISKQGLPLTLTAPTPAMDSKEDHFRVIRSSQLFDYPKLEV